MLVPITLFTAIAVTIVLSIYFRYRSEANIQKTIQAAIEQGQQLSPEILDRLIHPEQKKTRDLRRGVILIATGLGIGVFGFLVGDDNAVRPMLAIGTLPFLIGIAYLGLWKLSLRD
jgi:hypothetical protein